MANRVTQVAQEVVFAPTTGKGRVTQVAQEILFQPTTTNLRVTQLAIELALSGKSVSLPVVGSIGSTMFSAQIESGSLGGVPAHGGSNNLLIRLNTGQSVPADGNWYGLRVLSAAAPVPSGGFIAYNGWIRWDANATLPLGLGALVRIGMLFYDSNWNVVQENAIDLPGGNGTPNPMTLFNANLLINGYKNQYSSPLLSGANYAGPVGPAQIPNNAAYVRYQCAVFINNTSGSAFSTGNNLYVDGRFDDCGAVFMTDPTNQLRNRGSIVPTYNGGMTYSATSSSITWTWTNLAIYRTDGTTTPIPNGSQAITGLSGNTSYVFFPYWDEDLQGMQWVGGGVGSPGLAFVNTAGATFYSQAQAQFLVNHIPLSGNLMVAATVAVGSAPGGGTGGGAGRVCLRRSMLVLSRERGDIAIGDVNVGEEILGRHGWTTVRRTIALPNTTWIRITLDNGEQIECTPSHPFTIPDTDSGDDKVVRAMDLTMSHMMYIRDGVSTIRRIEVFDEQDFKVTLTCDPDHEFYAGVAAPDILTHNFMMYPS